MAAIFSWLLRRPKQLSQRAGIIPKMWVKRSAAQADEPAHFLGQVLGLARNAHILGMIPARWDSCLAINLLYYKKDCRRGTPWHL
jgi:hypothetical protein